MGMARERYTVEGRRDVSGVWWVQRNGVRVCSYPTRRKAHQVAHACSGGPQLDPSPTRINAQLRGLVDKHGIQTVRDHLWILSGDELKSVNRSLAGDSQIKIAKLCRVTQPSVVYCLQRASERIEYAIQRPFFDPLTMYLDLTGVLPCHDAKIVMRYWQMGCQSQVARVTGTTQGYVRHRLLRSIRCLEDFHQFHPYTKALRDLMSLGIIMRPSPRKRNRQSK
jgi:hypothetical protein